jgi:hypothetical protein
VQLYLKRYGCWIAFIAITGIMIVAVIALQPQPTECDEYRLMTLETGNMLDLISAGLLQGETIPRLSRIARLAANRTLSSIFTVNFSPDNSTLAISGIGYAREMVRGTFLWKLRHSKLCVLEVGDISEVDVYDNSFEAFSPDSQFVLLNKCASYGGIWADCYTLWDTQYNRLVNRFFDARFVRQGNEITLEYQQEANTPMQTSEQRWEVIAQESPSIETMIIENSVHLIDRNTGNMLLEIPVTGSVHDTQVSHDGKLLAIALTEPNENAPYFQDTYVELWGVIDN